MNNLHSASCGGSNYSTASFYFWPVLAIIGFYLGGCEQNGSRIHLAAADNIQAVAEPTKQVQVASAAGKYLAGRFARRSRDFNNAARLLTDALQLDKENRKIRRQAFFAMVASGRFEEATKLANMIVDGNNGAPISNLTLVVEEVRAKQFEPASKRLVDMPKRGMNTFTSPLLLAWLHFAKGEADKAVEVLDGLTRIASFAGLRNLHVGLIMDLSGNTVAAEAALKESVEKTASLRVVQAYGRFLERNGRPDEAKHLYQKFVAKSGSSDSLEAAFQRLKSGRKPERLVKNTNQGMAEVFFNMSGTLAQGRSTDLALIYGRFALRLRPDFPLAQVLLGGLLESLDRKNEALALYDAVSPASPLFWSARLRKAEALDELKRTDEAIAQLKQMAEERAEQYEPLTRLGDMLRAKKLYDEAASSYSLALERIGKLAENHWSLLYARGIAYERSKQWPRAEADFLRALQLSPEQPFVLNYLGYSWVDQGMHLDRARGMIERAVQLRPNDGYIVDSLGWVLYRLRDYEGAARRLERAVILRPEDPTINDHLGDAYWRVGRTLEARFQWRRALSLEPEKKEIPKIQKKLQRGLVDAPTKGRRG
ncbi:tetratricopeptide repeat protein [Alphaproteobacteria bacterium]|nr:tetratricopeptide repeat protein [Alphaproteobacteria bacterium]